jgi:hypothetical protein
MNMALVPIMSSVLDRTIVYTESEEQRKEPQQFLDESGLITSSNIHIEADDRYVVYGDTEVSVHELQAVQHLATQSGETSKANVFTGVLVRAELPFSVEGKTYISTEGDKTGFAHKTFWRDILGRSEVQETELESNDFERDLHVATTHPREAREILTPSFMVDLHDWWQEHEQNIRIAFIGKTMYLLLPDASIKFSQSTTSTQLEAIERYAWTVIRPIWRSIILVEDVARR